MPPKAKHRSTVAHEAHHLRSSTGAPPTSSNAIDPLSIPAGPGPSTGQQSHSYSIIASSRGRGRGGGGKPWSKAQRRAYRAQKQGKLVDRESGRQQEFVTRRPRFKGANDKDAMAIERSPMAGPSRKSSDVQAQLDDFSRSPSLAGFKSILSLSPTSEPYLHRFLSSWAASPDGHANEEVYRIERYALESARHSGTCSSWARTPPTRRIILDLARHAPTRELARKAVVDELYDARQRVVDEVSKGFPGLEEAYGQLEEDIKTWIGDAPGSTAMRTDATPSRVDELLGRFVSIAERGFTPSAADPEAPDDLQAWWSLVKEWPWDDEREKIQLYHHHGDDYLFFKCAAIPNRMISQCVLRFFGAVERKS